MQSRKNAMQMEPCDVFELFNVYAEWGGGRGGVPWANVKQMMKELDLLEGIPAQLVDAYVRENMVRADQDQDGMLSCQEFMAWLFGEVCALLPFRHLGAQHNKVSPLYNRYLYHAQRHRPAGCSKKMSGMQAGAFQAMAKDLGWCDDLRLRTNGVNIASSTAVSHRTQGQMEGGTRMQFVQFMAALRAISVRKRESYDAILYKVVGDGSAPPVIRSHSVNRAYRLATLTAVIPALVESPTEAPLRWTSEHCTRCGKEHSRWVGTDPSVRQLIEAGGPGEAMRNARHVNTRNVRAAFHRYCIKHNKGLMPPTIPNRPTDNSTASGQQGGWGTGSTKQHPPSGAPQHGDQHGTNTHTAGNAQQEAGQQGTGWGGLIVDMHSPHGDGDESQGEGLAGAGGAGREAAGDPWAKDGWPACCCMYKQMSLMELQTWLKACMDNRYIWLALQAGQNKQLRPVASSASFKGPRWSPGPEDWAERLAVPNPNQHRDPYNSTACAYQPLTPERLEAAFLTACSIASCYCSDTGSGIHDKPVAAGASLSATRGRLGPSSYGTPFDAGVTLSSATTRRAGSARGIATAPATLATLRPSSAVVSPSKGGTPFSLSGIRESRSARGLGQAHRAAVPTLNFPQFLEALRLVAEDIKGHPQHLYMVERNLACILHDLVTPGCPLEAHQSLAGQAPTGGTAAVARSLAAYGQSPQESGGARTWAP